MYEAARRFAINVSCIAVHHRNGPPRRCRASANSVGRFSSRWMYSQSGSARATRDDGWGGKIAASSAASSIPSGSGHEHPCRPPASRMRRPCRGRCPVPRRSSGGCAQARTPGAPLLERSAWTTSSEPSPSSFPRPTSARMEERAATRSLQDGWHASESASSCKRCAVERCTFLAGAKPAQQLVAPAGSNQSGSWR